MLVFSSQNGQSQGGGGELLGASPCKQNVYPPLVYISVLGFDLVLLQSSRIN